MYYRKYNKDQKYTKDLGGCQYITCKSKDNEFTWVLEGNNNYSN